MSFYPDLDLQLRRFIRTGSGLPAGRVLRGNSKTGRAPKTGPFATLLLIKDREIGLSTVRPVDTLASTTTRDIFQHRRAEYSLQFFRAGAEARTFAGWLDSDLARIEEERRGFRIQQPVEADQMDALVDGEWEPRIVLKLPVGYSSRVNQEVGRIEVADWTVRTVTTTRRGTVNAY